MLSLMPANALSSREKNNEEPRKEEDGSRLDSEVLMLVWGTTDERLSNVPDGLLFCQRGEVGTKKQKLEKGVTSSE